MESSDGYVDATNGDYRNRLYKMSCLSAGTTYVILIAGGLLISCVSYCHETDTHVRD